MGGEDTHVPEMFLPLPSSVVYAIHELFCKHVKGVLDGEPLQWRQLLLIFSAKVLHAQSMTQYRGICLVSVFAKWYMSCIMILLCNHMHQNGSFRWRRLLIFGFEEHHSAEQICIGLQLLLREGLEWKSAVPAFVLETNVKEAFDDLGLEVVLDS